jgi:hypothetical protein
MASRAKYKAQPCQVAGDMYPEEQGWFEQIWRRLPFVSFLQDSDASRLETWDLPEANWLLCVALVV